MADMAMFTKQLKQEHAGLGLNVDSILSEDLQAGGQEETKRKEVEPNIKLKQGHPSVSVDEIQFNGLS